MINLNHFWHIKKTLIIALQLICPLQLLFVSVLFCLTKLNQG